MNNINLGRKSLIIVMVLSLISTTYAKFYDVKQMKRIEQIHPLSKILNKNEISKIKIIKRPIKINNNLNEIEVYNLNLTLSEITKNILYKKKEIEKINKSKLANSKNNIFSKTIQIQEYTKPMQYLRIKDKNIEFINSYFTSTAPKNEAGLWYGEGVVDNNQLDYYIGHNPGVFDIVLELNISDEITVNDKYGNERVYYIESILDIPCDSYFDCETLGIVDFNGNTLIDLNNNESIVLQTCNGDYYRIILAY